ncbi:MAG: pyridoxal-dependent decarboxylase, exosortase A system-associated [Rheinheimera sp.]|uniref:pyridoxal-dependent decarboxylase, exosortase A system-associated n=1 Tax=Arsukibacterium sp. UBA3155 TaxID=1946058 RepID=UPI000C95D35C|nr:pyridoxal-dependent decarboxylase, exosortase A system-associated [Arsukibacterium sp. UBA3155]MAD74815.1 pyridoxal-dependent decarboxylase, exosortase A system-associated [Rheinheimera sp.]|tara:strand:- start:43212 stop:44477 length:1266 start_codon:yes stop_codon:yes gene_type:complete
MSSNSANHTGTNNNAPQHEQMSQFSTQNGQLLAAGFSMTEISQLLNRPAFYVYDRSIINQQVASFRRHIPSRIKLHYAVKANPYWPVVEHLKPLVDGFDVASQKEMLLAIQSGMPVADISFAGPGKGDAELLSAIIAGVTLNVESLGELKRICALGAQTNKTPQVALRVNPAFELKASGMKMAGGAKPFGIDEEQVLELLADIADMPVKLRGFHIFCGSQNLKAEALIEAHQHTFALAAKLVAACPYRPEMINLGGGFGIPYFAGERRLNLAPVGESLQDLLQQYDNELAGIELVIELGRYLVAEAGLYACQVVDKKHSRGTTYLVCNGGLHHHLANSGNFGQVIRKNYPVAIANRFSQSETELVTIVGPLCTPLDILADRMNLPKAEVGDWVVVYQSGAYGPTASPQDFLGHPNVAEILL